MKTNVNLRIYRFLLMGFVLIFASNCKKDNSDDPANTVLDKDGNVYHTITIATVPPQTWMVENLKTTLFNDGSPITCPVDNAGWQSNTTGAYCWYNNVESNKSTYGALYNFYAISSGKLCPSGWHVPTNDEWNALIVFYGGTSLAGGKLKESGTAHWNTPNTGADNSSGFTALPGGFRHSGTGVFQQMNTIANWWSSTPINASSAFTWYMSSSSTNAASFSSSNVVGSSVRCIKDSGEK